MFDLIKYSLRSVLYHSYCRFSALLVHVNSFVVSCQICSILVFIKLVAFLQFSIYYLLDFVFSQNGINYFCLFSTNSYYTRLFRHGFFGLSLCVFVGSIIPVPVSKMFLFTTGSNLILFLTGSNRFF